MSLRDCITDAVNAGEMDRGRANEALELFDDLEAEFKQTVNDLEAARRAAAETIRAVRLAAAENRRRTLLQARVTRRIQTDMDAYRNVRGEADPGAAMLAHLDPDELATFSNVEARRKAVLGRLHSGMDRVLSTFRRDLVGRTRNKAQLRNMVREVFGENTGDAAARELAQAWSQTAETARLRFNAAGGRIPKREDWGLPQQHDTLRVRQVGFETWRDEILPRLDTDRMLDEVTGLPLRGSRLDDALRQAYETIRSDGFARMTPSGAPGGRALANRRIDHRFLVFRSPDDWLAYQERFGSADPFSVMVGHLESMARDIAQLEILGPNPNATVRWMGQVVEQRAGLADAAAGTTGQLDRARRRIKQANDMMDHITGTANTPIDGLWARSFAGLRSFLQSAQLGAASLSAITDVNFQRLAAQHAGLPQAATVQRVAKLLRPTVTEDQRTAVRLGLIAENWSSQALAQQRYLGEVTGPEITKRLADFTMRVSLLSPWTQAGRWAFGMEFMGFLAESVGRTFDELPGPLQRTLGRYGFDAGQWDRLRATDLYDVDGATFLRPDEMAARTDIPDGEDLATRLLEMIQTETEFAVPSASLRGRVMVIGDNRPGTISGELLRSVAMYKNFAITVAFTHIRRAMLEKGAMNRGRYFANLVISTTLMGALALQMKEIAKGRDPRPVTGKRSAEFWAAAMLQGGGLGIFGDFLFSDVNRFDRGLSETVAGPVVGFFNDVRRLTLGNAAQLPGEDRTNAGRELVGFLKRYTPGGSLWYARLGYERLILDELQRQVDPQARRQFRRQRQRFRRDFGQDYFWEPGRRAPSRAPDFSNIIGGS